MTSCEYPRSVVPRWRRSQLRHTSAVARHTCSIVTSGFFFPEELGVLGDETQGNEAEGEVTHEAGITLALKVAEAEVALGGAEAVFHVPTAEGHTHKHFYRDIGRGVREEELLLARLVVARPDQPERFHRPTRGAVQPHARRLDAPDLVFFRRPRQPQHLPRLILERHTTLDHVFGLSAFHLLVRTLAIFVDRRAREGARHFPDKQLATVGVVQPEEEARASAIAFIEGHPVQEDAALLGPVPLLQADLPLGAADHRVGDAGGLATLAVVPPLLGQVEVGVEQGLEGALADTEVNGDDAVIHLAQETEILARDAGCLASRLGSAGLVEEADVAQIVPTQMRQQGSNVLLIAVAGLLEGPDVV